MKKNRWTTLFGGLAGLFMLWGNEPDSPKWAKEIAAVAVIATGAAAADAAKKNSGDAE